MRFPRMLRLDVVVGAARAVAGVAEVILRYVPDAVGRREHHILACSAMVAIGDHSGRSPSLGSRLIACIAW